MTHHSLPSLNLIQIKQDAIVVPIVLVALNLLIALVAEVAATRCANHVIAALAALNCHATAWTLLAVFLQVHQHSLIALTLQLQM